MCTHASTNFRFPIAVKVWAGDEPRDFEYISRSLPSLLASDLPAGADVVVFNDRSTDPRLAPFLKKLQSADSRVRVIEHEFNKGPNLGQADAFALLADEYADAEYFVSVDDDAVYHRDWFRRIQLALSDVRPLGINGVFTSFCTPFRKPHTQLQVGPRTRGVFAVDQFQSSAPKADFGADKTNSHWLRKYHLKWKQPATNWLIPRDVYEHVGPFRDEGIAFDTVYSHRMRLLGYSVICPVESYVQDIGLVGAYAVDNRLCADRFLGEGDGDPVWKRGLTWSRYHLSRIGRELRASRHRQPKILWPVRWGTDWLYEAVASDGSPVALWSTDQDVDRGWERSQVAVRAEQILRNQPDGPFALRRVHRSRHGDATLIESSWRTLPNLREAAELFPDQLPSPREMLQSIALQLIPFHRAGIGHGKVRPENLFFDAAGRSIHLAWLGPEAPRQGFDPMDAEQPRQLFGNAVDRRCRDSVRDTYAKRFMATLPPEHVRGGEPTCAADIYALAATVLVIRDGCRVKPDVPLQEVIRGCLMADMPARIPNATELLAALDGSSVATAAGGVS